MLSGLCAFVGYVTKLLRLRRQVKPSRADAGSRGAAAILWVGRTTMVSFSRLRYLGPILRIFQA
ncbi:hypothetical protein MLPF_3107 [Mycobacterium lepromatosis]|nr:hypothetical protein MLPF_3107 [Mycobacterium lepromatosis]